MFGVILTRSLEGPVSPCHKWQFTFLGDGHVGVNVLNPVAANASGRQNVAVGHFASLSSLATSAIGRTNGHAAFLYPCIASGTHRETVAPRRLSKDAIVPMKTSLQRIRTARMHRLGSVVRVGFAIMSLGCASYTGTAHTVDPYAAVRKGKWWMVPSFPRVMQDTSNDCGAAALAAVMRFWGHGATSESIEATLGRTDHRLRAGDMVEYARRQGLHSYVFFGTMTDIAHELRRGRPIIVGLGKSIAEKKALSHYEVVVGYEPEKKLVLLLDPGRGWQVDTLRGFAEEWARTKGVTVVAFLSGSDQNVSQLEAHASAVR